MVGILGMIIGVLGMVVAVRDDSRQDDQWDFGYGPKDFGGGSQGG